MKKLLIILIVVGTLISAGGCESVQLDGFSIGVIYLNTDINTTTSGNTPFGQFTGQQTTRIEGFMPTASLNFKFK